MIDIAAAKGGTGSGVSSEVVWSEDGAATLGALTTIAASAQGLATPLVRDVATLGGNLAQRSRCWYFRNPRIDCLKKAGSACPARAGNQLHGTVFDLGPCVAPHPSTIAAALLACDARIVTRHRAGVTVADLLGNGSDGHADHALSEGEIITAVVPAPLAAERAAYRRAIARAAAKWPLVEVCARVRIDGGQFAFVRLAAGGVAPVRLRL